MKIPLKNIAAITGISLVITLSQTSAQLIFFGGDAGNIAGTDPADINWQNAVGADQIIQWNGANSGGGPAGNSGSLFNQGVGGSLTSLGTENLVLTTTALSALDTTGITTSATNLPQFLGVNSAGGGGANVFDSAQEEIWTFSFNQDVVLTQMVGRNMQFNGQRFGVDIGANGTYDFEWTRTGFTVGSGSVTAASFGGFEEYLATFGSGISISSGTEVAFTSLQGPISLQGLVVNVIPEPSSFALLAGLGSLGLILLRRRR